MTRRAPRRLAFSVELLRNELAPPTDLARIQAAWEQAVGAALAAAASPVSLLDGTLLLDCASSVWASELTMMADTLCSQLNEALGASSEGVAEPLVQRIRCRTR